MNHNDGKLKTFLNRKVNGLKISDRVWKYQDGLVEQLEAAIDGALAKGQSAASLARDIKKYLNNPDALYRRVRDKHGNLKLSANALKYNPGQGVYRSAYQNALRLSRTEINKAYRQSDYERCQQMDFVIGYEIHPSQRFYTAVCDLCTSLAGKYPKDFKFWGWHPSCRCHCTPIMVSDSTFEKILSGKSVKLDQPAIPPNFRRWYKKNLEKIEKNMPDFVAENMKLIA